MARYFLTFVFIFPLSFSLFAKVHPENVMGISCLASYNNTYLPLKDAKVFIYARERETDKDKCSWAYGFETLEQATENALKGCEGKLNAKCQVIDKNGEFIVKRAQFFHLEPVDKTPLSEAEKLNLIKQAKTLVLGNCLPFFKKYLEAKGHKSFGYSVDDDGKYACGYSYSNQTKNASQRQAIKSCEDNKKKRGDKKPSSACKLYATSHKIVLTDKDYGLATGHLEQKAYITALHKGKIKKVKDYIEKGADINAVAEDGMSPLFLAVSKGDDEWFYELVAKGADLKHKMKDGSNLLIAATFGESPDIMRYLLKNGFDINSKGLADNRPIHVAFIRLNTYLIKMLIREGADLTLKNSQGVSGLDRAKKGKIDINAAKLIKPNEAQDGFYPLFDAVKYGDLVMIDLLVKQGADINKIEQYGMSPYSMAKNKATIELLHKLGADVNHQDDDGETALMYRSDELDKVKSLLALGADKNIKDTKDKTAFDRIKSRKTVSDKIKELLK